MIHLNMNKSLPKPFDRQPWVICLVWNIVVLAATLTLVIHEHNPWYCLMCVLVSWPDDESEESDE
jgi:hypothetical protein